MTGQPEAAEKFIDIFGKRQIFCGNSEHHGLYDQRRLNAGLIKLARELDLGIVSTNDIHYVERKDAEFQGHTHVTFQMGKTVDDEERMKMEELPSCMSSLWRKWRSCFPIFPRQLRIRERLRRCAALKSSLASCTCPSLMCLRALLPMSI